MFANPSYFIIPYFRHGYLSYCKGRKTLPRMSENSRSVNHRFGRTDVADVEGSSTKRVKWIRGEQNNSWLFFDIDFNKSVNRT